MQQTPIINTTRKKLNKDTILRVQNLQTIFSLRHGDVHAVEDASFTIHKGKAFAIVGESGCGKTMTAYSILNLIPKPGRIVSGSIVFTSTDKNTGIQESIELTQKKKHGTAMRSIRGNDIAMIFQEPMNSLSPVHTIGNQIIEVLRLHRNMDKKSARLETIQLLTQVGIADATKRVDSYTFELSGGMRQRAMIAMALACEPQLLIADEPTTALDVTTQAQILDLIDTLRERNNVSMLLITHDLGVVAQTCDDVAVMYLGEIVEQSSVLSLFENPLHPYTQALLRSTPILGKGRNQNFRPIKGSVPDPLSRPQGCPFHSRCDYCIKGLCDQERPPLSILDDNHSVRCWLHSKKSQGESNL